MTPPVSPSPGARPSGCARCAGRRTRPGAAPVGSNILHVARVVANQSACAQRRSSTPRSSNSKSHDPTPQCLGVNAAILGRPRVQSLVFVVCACGCAASGAGVVHKSWVGTQGSLAGSLCANSGQSAFQIYGRVLPRPFCRCRFTQSSILRRAAALAPSRDPRNLTTAALSWAALSGK